MAITDDIKARIDLVRYIERHVPKLKKTGKYYKANCPFHDDRTPSFVINPETQQWRCYGACAEGGDLFTFYEKFHHVAFKDALKALADEAGLELPENKKFQRTQKQQRQLALLTDLAASYHNLLQNYDGAAFVRDYLASRHITPASIEQWQLGYAPKQNIIPKLLKQGHQKADLLELGIAYEQESGQLRSRFYNRLMIPIYDGAGQVVGFGARQLAHGHGAKYVNSHDAALFQKSALLYGWHLAKTTAKLDGQIVVVEGYMDAIQAHQAGYTNVVAQMGTALTDAQVGLIADHHIETITLCLDGDDAGQQATQRAVDHLIGHVQTRDIRIIQLPAGQDPDDIIQAGGWETAVAQATPVIDYLIDTHVATLPANASLGQKHNLANQLIPRLYRLDDDTYKLWSVQRLALKLGLNAMALADMARQLMTGKPAPVTPPDTPDIPASVQAHPIEAYIIRCLIEQPGWYWDVLGGFDRLGIPPLNRTDFVAFGDTFQQIVDAVESDGHPGDYLELDPATLSDLAPETPAVLTINAARLRLKSIQRTMDECADMREIERFSAFLAQRTHLSQQLAQTL